MLILHPLLHPFCSEHIAVTHRSHGLSNWTLVAAEDLVAAGSPGDSSKHINDNCIQNEMQKDKYYIVTKVYATALCNSITNDDETKSCLALTAPRTAHKVLPKRSPRVCLFSSGPARRYAGAHDSFPEPRMDCPSHGPWVFPRRSPWAWLQLCANGANYANNCRSPTGSITEFCSASTSLPIAMAKQS